METLQEESPAVKWKLLKEESPAVKWKLLFQAALCAQPDAIYGGGFVCENRLNLYYIDMKYVRDLSKKDSHVMAVSPQTSKQNRPFLGIIIICSNKQYCVPLSSPKEKYIHKKNSIDFSKVMDGDTVIGVLNFNNMIPVNEKVIRKINLSVSPWDSTEQKKYKSLLRKQLSWCRKHQDEILRKSQKLYFFATQEPQKIPSVVRRCCDYLLLEKVLQKW